MSANEQREVPPAEPMVNRELELDLLTEHLRRAATGAAGHAVLLLGESGVGKSRLVAELLAQAAADEITAIVGHCVGRGAEPLLPIKEALAAHLGRTPEVIRSTLVTAAPRLLDLIPFIGGFLGRLGEAFVQQRRQRTSIDGVYEELSQILVGISDNGGLCFVIEDLHAADQDTLFFLNYLLHKVRGRRLLAVLTIQLEQLGETPQLADLVAQWTAQGYAALTVVPLERAHVGELVRSLSTAGAEPDDALVDRLFRLTAGNPFYLRETLRLLSGSGDAADTVTPEALAVPPRVDAVLRRRLARADSEIRYFLRCAAVTLETNTDLEVIAHVMDAPAGTAVRAFASACELHLMREGTNGEVSFVHHLMQRTVYVDLVAAQRRYLHQRAAQWCAQAGQLASAAFHFERAGQTAEMVSAALDGAARAEQGGMYHSALMLYQKARPHMAIEDIGPRLGQVMLTLGEWDQAEEVIALLPTSDGRVRLLRSKLWFVRGDFRRAQDEALAALESSQVERGQALARLADIALYLGDFTQARARATQALAEGDEGTTQVPYLTILGITAYHGGDLQEAEARFGAALDLVRNAPEEQRDVVTETMLMGNLGNVALSRGDLPTATGLHAEALRMRREVADARGALHSLHALGQCQLALGERDQAEQLFDQADQLAERLGETLERAKITQTRSELVLRDGDAAAAYDLAAGALASFERSSTYYDITHARLAASAAAQASGREREAVELAAAGRAAITHRGYGLLRAFYPDVGYVLEDRLAGALTAYACGDALGLPYENLPPTKDPTGAIETLHARGIWSAGDTSDDTALTLLAAECLVGSDGEADARHFLRELAAKRPPVRGLGPSTTAALETFRATEEVPVDLSGATNGAAMRALPVGWMVPATDPARLRRITFELSRATHRAPVALAAAYVVATCASWAVEGASPSLLLEVAQEAADDAGDQRLGSALGALAAGSWAPPPDGVTMDPVETVTAALSVVTRGLPLRESLVEAVRLGGDADTVTALVGGLVGARMTRDEVLSTLPWSAGVTLPAADETRKLATGLARLRAGAYADPAHGLSC